MTKTVDRKIISTLFFMMVVASCEIFNAMTVLADNPKARRYPTDAEIKKAMPEFRRQVQYWEKGRSRFQRTQAEINELDAFTKAWAGRNPNSLPFLGDWSSSETFTTIYPSTVKDKVCVVTSGGGTSGGNGISGNTYVDLNIGKVINNQIRTSDLAIIFRQGNYLGTLFVYGKDNVGVGAYLPPKRPPKLSEIHLIEDQSKSSQEKLLREFTQAGCKDSIP